MLNKLTTIILQYSYVKSSYCTPKFIVFYVNYQVIQVYAPTSNAEGAEVEQSHEDL